MPVAKKVLNAFPASEFSRITGLSLHMVNYLSDHGFLKPTFGNPYGTRGKVRYYSYRDLVIGRLIQRLREGGVELARLKEAIETLAVPPDWITSVGNPADQVRWLVTDGKAIHFQSQDGFLDDLRTRQRSFAFIVDLDELAVEVRRRVTRKKRKHFNLGTYELLIEEAEKKSA